MTSKYFADVSDTVSVWNFLKKVRSEEIRSRLKTLSVTRFLIQEYVQSSLQVIWP